MDKGSESSIRVLGYSCVCYTVVNGTKNSKAQPKAHLSVLFPLSGCLSGPVTEVAAPLAGSFLQGFEKSFLLSTNAMKRLRPIFQHLFNSATALFQEQVNNIKVDALV